MQKSNTIPKEGLETVTHIIDQIQKQGTKIPDYDIGYIAGMLHKSIIEQQEQPKE